MRKSKTLSRLFLIHHADRVRFAAYTTTPGLLLGVYLFTVPLAAGHVYFFISLPLAVWVSAWFGWKLAMKPEDRHSLLTLLGLSIWLTLSST